jgi:predicted acyl esterase
VEQRPSWLTRHFLLRCRSVVGGSHAASAPESDAALAGYLRFLPRPHAAGRNFRQRLCQTLVEPERAAQSARHTDTPFTDIDTDERTTGPAALSSSELEANRADYVGDILAHPLLDEWYRERIPDLQKIEIPALVVANWGGLGLHLRGTIEGYLGIASSQKWLKVQTGSYFVTFLTAHSVQLQRRFF